MKARIRTMNRPWPLGAAHRVGAFALACLLVAGTAAPSALAGEPIAAVQYCSYDASGLTAKDATALTNSGYIVNVTPDVNNSGYVCVQCPGTSGCLGSNAEQNAINLIVPNAVLVGAASGTCGPCADPLTV